MSREIKFRAWNKEEKEWVVGAELVELYWLNGAFVPVGHIDYFKNQSNCVFMQFTGLKDSKGVEIYAADIIQAINPIKLERGEQADYTGLVAWSTKSLAWVLVDKNGKFIDMLCRVEQPEIIGNITDTPKLMEPKNG